jgi:hypothetical protein
MGNREQLRLQPGLLATAVHVLVEGEKSTHYVSIEPDETWTVAARATGLEGKVLYEATKMLITSTKGPTRGKIIATNHPRRKPGEQYKLSPHFWNFLGDTEDPTNLALYRAGVTIRDTVDTIGDKRIPVIETTFPHKTIGEVLDNRKNYGLGQSTSFRRLRVIE